MAGVARSGVYRGSTEEVVSAWDRLLLALIDAEYTCHPFDGSRRLVVFLKAQGQVVNRKRVQRRMGTLGLAGMAPGPNTRQPRPEHHVYPYLLHGTKITHSNQVWSTDNIFVERLWQSVKDEDIYLKSYASLPELLLGLTEYFAFDNHERPHQSLGYLTPEAVYRSGEGGDAKIVDRFGETTLGQRQAAAMEVGSTT